jgi:hypothetical protein
MGFSEHDLTAGSPDRPVLSELRSVSVSPSAYRNPASGLPLGGSGVRGAGGWPGSSW